MEYSGRLAAYQQQSQTGGEHFFPVVQLMEDNIDYQAGGYADGD
jgi:hypothetical protein